MGWEAPNLLGSIFKDPEVADSNAIGNFMGGFMARRDLSAQQAADKQAKDDDEEGSPSGDSDLTGKPATDTSWAGNWLRATMQGQQMSKNIVAYQQATTQTRLAQAQTAGAILENQSKQKTLQDAMDDQTAIHDWQQGSDPKDLWNKPAPFLKTLEGRAAVQEIQGSGAKTLFAQAQQEYQKQLLAQATTLLGEGIDVPVDPKTGMPDPKAVAAGGKELSERKAAQRHMDNMDMLDRQLAVTTQRGEDTEHRQLRVVQAKAESAMALFRAKQAATADPHTKAMDKAKEIALSNKMQAITHSTNLSGDEKEAKMDELLKEFNLTPENLRFDNPGSGGGTPASPNNEGGDMYADPDAVKAAYKRKEISKEQAAEILKNQFDY